jgi:hypothetical protein
LPELNHRSRCKHRSAAVPRRSSPSGQQAPFPSRTPTLGAISRFAPLGSRACGQPRTRLDDAPGRPEHNGQSRARSRLSRCIEPGDAEGGGDDHEGAPAGSVGPARRRQTTRLARLGSARDLPDHREREFGPQTGGTPCLRSLNRRSRPTA